MYCKTTYASPVGTLTLACDGDKLCGLWNEGQRYFGGALAADIDAMAEGGDMPVFAAARAWLDRYFAGDKPDIAELPLSPIGSEFRQMVWSILCGIPYGEVTTYGAIAKEVAARMGRSGMSSQAVGGAVGHNPVSIIIPCHRVVGSDGSMTGYAGGAKVKVRLLALEGVDISRLSIPPCVTMDEDVTHSSCPMGSQGLCRKKRRDDKAING